MAFAAHDIVATGGRGEPRGHSSSVDSSTTAVAARVAKTSQLPVQLHATAAASSDCLQQVVGCGPPRAPASEPRAPATDEQNLDIYGVLRDLDGASAAVIQTHTDRTLLEFGQRTLNSLMLLISAVVVLVAVGVASLLLRMEGAGAAGGERAALSRGDHAGAGHDAAGRCDGSKDSRSQPGRDHDTRISRSRCCSRRRSTSCSSSTTAAPCAPCSPNCTPPRCRIWRFRFAARTAGWSTSKCPPARSTSMGAKSISFVLRDVSARKDAERALVDNQQRLTQVAHHDARSPAC